MKDTAGKKKRRKGNNYCTWRERASEEWKIDEKQMRDQKTNFLVGIKTKNKILNRLQRQL